MSELQTLEDLKDLEIILAGHMRQQERNGTEWIIARECQRAVEELIARRLAERALHERSQIDRNRQQADRAAPAGCGAQSDAHAHQPKP